MKFRSYLFLLAALALIPALTAAASSKSPSDLQTLKIYFENDLFRETDKYYTNAVQLTWLSKDLKRYKDDVRLPEWSIPMLKASPFSETPGSIHNVGILIGQHIYTPADIQETGLQPDDRPYAGYLFAGVALHSKTDRVLDTLEVSFGVVGSEALAEEAQNTVHELRDIPTAKGWQNQLHTEPVIRFSWQRKWRLFRETFFDTWDLDLISHAGLTLGNVRASANTGGEIRFGYHIPMDFGSDAIRPGSGASAPVIHRTAHKKHAFGCHWFFAAQIEGVGHDIFLDGNTFQDSPGVEKEKGVVDVSTGFSLNFNHYQFTYRHLYRTKQFVNQKQDHIIGSLTLTLAF